MGDGNDVSLCINGPPIRHYRMMLKLYIILVGLLDLLLPSVKSTQQANLVYHF